MAYKQSSFPMAYGSKKHEEASIAKQTADRKKFEEENLANEIAKDEERKSKDKPKDKPKKGKIIYKDGKKYYQASDGSLHTGQVEDYEKELAIDKANAPNKQKKNEDKPVKPTIKELDKYSDLEKYDDDNPTGKPEPPKKGKKKQ